MKTVNVANLKSQLSAFLYVVQRGEEVLIKERNRPIAKIVPLSIENADERLMQLAAEGALKLPEQAGGIPPDLRSVPRVPRKRIKQSMTVIMAEDRDGR